jgi:hypothetical protein
MHVSEVTRGYSRGFGEKHDRRFRTRNAPDPTLAAGFKSGTDVHRQDVIR